MTYEGALTFEKFWDIDTQMFSGWVDDLEKPDSFEYAWVARRMELQVEQVLKLAEPSNDDWYTYISDFVQDGNKIVAHFKTFPMKPISSKINERINKYVTERSGNAGGLTGLESNVNLQKLDFVDYCEQDACLSPFQTCRNDYTEKECRCNPGFVLLGFGAGAGTCQSYCAWRRCEIAGSHSCRDRALTGPECLCKEGYALNSDGVCTGILSYPM